jgi:hypothetical protein
LNTSGTWKVIILHLAATKEYGFYKDLVKNQKSYIENFQNKRAVEYDDIDEKTFRKVAHEFQEKVKKALVFSALFQKESQKKVNKEKL